jgi:hypothetical protein
MTMPEALVSPPAETPALYGLFSAARILPLSGHEEGGVVYDVVCERAIRHWPAACQPALPPVPFERTVTLEVTGGLDEEDVPRTITTTITGTRTSGTPIARTITVTITGAFTTQLPDSYSVRAAATVSSGAPRQLNITVNADPVSTITTGNAPVEVATFITFGSRNIVVTDVLTGTVSSFTVTQQVTGTITHTPHQFVANDIPFTYHIFAQSVVDSGPVRLIEAAVDGGPGTQYNTGDPPTEIFTSSTSGSHTIDVTDVLTTATMNFPVTQQVDGTIIMVPQELVATDIILLYEVFLTATVDSGPPRVLNVTVNGGPVVVVTTGDPPTEIFESTSSGSRTIDVTDVASGEDTSFAVNQDGGGTIVMAPVEFEVFDLVDAEKIPGLPATRVIATPFLVYGLETCLLGLTMDETIERARLRLAANEDLTVEYNFWTGEIGNTPNLAGSTPEILGGSAVIPVDLTTGLSLLEEWLGLHTRFIGFIHVNRAAAAVAAESTLATRAGNRLETSLGNVWVFGSGYPRTGPEGQPAPTGRQFWMFATRQPTIRRTEIFVPAELGDGAALNYRKNNAFVLAERVYVVDFPCETAAVKVDLSLCRCEPAP